MALEIFVSKDSLLLGMQAKKFEEDESIYPIVFPENSIHPQTLNKFLKVTWFRSIEVVKRRYTPIITNSASLISIVGDLICNAGDGSLAEVVIIGEDNEWKHYSFDDDGCLIDWPIGFFNYD